MMKFRALLYREWRLTRKFYLIQLLVLILFIVLCFLVRLSMEIGNLKSLMEEEEGAFFVTACYYIFVYFVAFAASAAVGSDNGIIKSDVTANWMLYSYALPVKPHDRAAVRTFLRLCCYAAAFVCCILNAVLQSKMADRPMNGAVVLNLLIPFDLALLLEVIRDAFICRAKNAVTLKKQNAKAIVITLLLSACICITAMLKISAIMADKLAAGVKYAEENEKNFSDEIQLDIILGGFKDEIMKIRDVIVPWLVPGLVLLFVLSYAVARYAYGRREKA